MLVIRKEQMESLEEVALKNFEDRMVAHFCKEFAPLHCEVIGEEGTHEVVRFGIEAAEKYEFTNRGPIQFYLEMMFMFGGRFDTDPQFDWAGAILNDAETPDQTERADKLYEETLAYLDKVAGEKREHAIAAFRRINETNFDNIADETRDIEPQSREWTKKIYPQKYEYAGEERINRTIESGKRTAEEHKITTKKGQMLCIALAFAMGHGFADDVLFPWIKATLTDEKFPDPNERTERLQRKLKIYVEKAVKNLEKK